MKDDKTLVKLIDVEEFKRDMKTIEKYCDFIDTTLRKLSQKESVYLKDLNKCIERINNIKRYALFKSDGNDIMASVSFLYDEM